RLYCWGANSNGRLGTGDNEPAISPSEVSGNSTNWSAVGSGDNHTCGIRSDETLWCWGSNAVGQLGLDNISMTSSNVPKQVTSVGDGWLKTAGGSKHNCAIKKNGTLWCWGENLSGQVGDNTEVQRNAPVFLPQ